ncbi:DMT family transporter [Vibrio diazotrophicus]|uniref:Drug/metabolite transporter (DMT)-like permease n=1 Tax=Vibrio diazotrophicus TaxID=685 RepID=A0A329E8J7_VIBDI|nr:DMT family transporter [Vibrio diazotrophicus]PNH95389.1 EamA family transporter [Vibrio diazotrophicus]RAS62761.1 drug/metabolite transporter (DMT)-like permease [Vibrio diazotrophicus]
MPSQSTHFFSRPMVVYAIAILCTVLWGSAYPAIKTGYALLNIEAHDVASQMVFAGQRFLLAGIFLIILSVLFRRHTGTITKTKVRQIVVLGLTQTSLQYIFFYLGVAFATGVKASILNATGTFFSVLLAHFIYHNDRLTQRKAIGCTVGFLGVFIVNFNQSLLDFQFSVLGEGSVIFAAFILAAASIYGKKISQGIDAMVMTAWQLAIGGLALLCVGYLFGGHSGDFDFASLSLLIYLACLSSAAFALWSVLLKHNPVSMVTIFNFLIPVFGSSLSSIFLGETILEWKNMVALILVCSGIYLVTKSKKPSS